MTLPLLLQVVQISIVFDFIITKGLGMERTVAVFYKDALAYYNVLSGPDSSYTVRLLKYNGSPDCTPPKEFHIHKEGRRWIDDGHVQQDMIDEIGYSIDLLQRETEAPRYHSPESWQKNDRSSPHP